jgi:hypothetical protein
MKYQSRFFYYMKANPFRIPKTAENVPNNAKAKDDGTTTNARNILPVYLVRFDSFQYVKVRFGTSACRVGFFGMKLSLEGDWCLMFRYVLAGLGMSV